MSHSCETSSTDLPASTASTIETRRSTGACAATRGSTCSEVRPPGSSVGRAGSDVSAIALPRSSRADLSTRLPPRSSENHAGPETRYAVRWHDGGRARAGERRGRRGTRGRSAFLRLPVPAPAARCPSRALARRRAARLRRAVELRHGRGAGSPTARDVRRPDDADDDGRGDERHPGRDAGLEPVLPASGDAGQGVDDGGSPQRRPVEVALGVGDPSAGAMAAGVDWTPGEQVARFAEFVELVDLLLRQEVTSYRGPVLPLRAGRDRAPAGAAPSPADHDCRARPEDAAHRRGAR